MSNYDPYNQGGYGAVSTGQGDASAVAGGGAFGSVSVTANAAATLGNLNNGAGSVWLYRKHPVALPGGSTFSLLLRYGNRMGSLAAGDPSIFVKLVLMGYYKNVIEIG